MTASQAISAALDHVDGQTGYHIVTSPEYDTPTEVVEYLVGVGATTLYLWSPYYDGIVKVRGVGVVKP